jgi:hypothetical protein
MHGGVALEWDRALAQGGNMRRYLALATYLLMMGVGAAILAWIFVFSSGGRGIAVLAGATLVLFGGYLVWMDFLAPDRET